MNDDYNDRVRLSNNIQKSDARIKISNQRQKANSRILEGSRDTVEENLPSLEIKEACSPFVCLFTFLFKVLGIVWYMLVLNII